MNDLGPAEHDSIFVRIRRVTGSGGEYWSSRDLAKALGYTDYRSFEFVIGKAKTACFVSGLRPEEHFVNVSYMSEEAPYHPVSAVFLSRYACYLIVQNADPSKTIVAVGQTYFAEQTRRQEKTDQEQASRDLTDEDKDRLRLREGMKVHNKKLASAAKKAGVVEPRDYAIFQNHGYQGLYGGLSMQEIHQRKGLKKSQQILDHMGSTELAANMFRATQAEEKIRRENITGKDKANAAHREIGAKVRQTIREMGGTPPELLPTPGTSIKQLETKKKKVVKRLPKKD